MKVISKKFKRKIFKSITLFSSIVLTLNMSMVGVFFVPTTTSASEVVIETCLGGDCPHNKVTICHATDSELNPWTRIVVSSNAIGGHFENPGTPKAGHEDDLLFEGEVECPGPAHYCGDGNVDPGEECDDGNEINDDECNNGCALPAGECKLELIKTADPETSPGEQIVYHLTLENIGSAYCSGGGVLLRDNFDDQTSYVGANPSPDTIGSDYVQWNFGIMHPGDLKEIELVVNVSPEAECQSVIKNSAHYWAEQVGGGEQVYAETNVICHTPEPECGNNIIEDNEECDDGNLVNGDGCNSQCLIEYCGDGTINQTTEQCDDNGQNGQICTPSYGGSCTYCSNTCQSITLTGPYCGDEIKNGTEECDGQDGVGANQTCTANCTLEDILCEEELDVVFIMDRSGSMGYDIPTRMSLAKTAANSFADKLRTGDQSAMVSYASGATLDKTLSNDHNATKTAINALIASGATNIGDAISLATGESISVRANPQAAKIQILMTDGKANKPNGPGYDEYPADVAYAKAKADEAAAQGIKIFTIGLGSDVNVAMLQYIAATTGGEYHFAPTGGDLDEIFDSIAFEACQYGSISGCKYKDTNNDGNISGEPTISGWKINLTNGSVNRSQLTDQSGCYTFAGLSAGNYTVAEDPVQPYAFIQTYPLNPPTYSVDLTEGQTATNKDFGNYLPECGNGLSDEGEQCDNNGQNGQVCTPSYGGSCTYCSNTCQSITLTGPYCGDEIKNGTEECDDGNQANGDGCSAVCQIESDIEPGDIVINEIMQNPDKVSDTDGEWLEMANTTSVDIDLKDCIIKDSGTNNHIISSSLIVPANGYAVLARNGNPAVNGGFTANYVYNGSFVLGNDDDEIILTCNEVEIDRVEYDNGLTFPDPAGKSMILNSPLNNNNVGGNWCVSGSPFGDGDLGTPGAPNDSCSPFTPGIISGYKYEDADGLVSTTGDRTTLAGWIINLFNSLSTTTPIATTSTNSNGYYEFNNLLMGNYSLGEVLLNGWIMLSAPISPIAIISGMISQNNDFINHHSPVEFCGDGIKNGEETCDGSSGTPEHYICTQLCALEYVPYCGDGIKNGAEECDGADGVGSNQTCTASCTIQSTVVISGGGGGTFIPKVSPIVLGEVGSPSLSVEKSVNLQFVNPGEEAEYTVKIINNGNLTAYDVKLNDVLPNGFTLVEGGGTAKDLTIGDIGPGENKVVTYKVKVSDKTIAGIYANLAEVSALNNDPVSDSVDLEVRKIEVLGEELTGTGFDLKEFFALIAILAVLLGLAVTLKRKYQTQ